MSMSNIYLERDDCSVVLIDQTLIVGVTRLERWDRANKHDLNPPQSVRNLILNHSEDTDYTERYSNKANILNGFSINGAHFTR